MKYNIGKCQLLSLPQVSSSSGDLTFFENSRHIPFDIQRVYYLSNLSANSQRGFHAHRNLHQLIIAVSGSFTIELDDGFTQKSLNLATPAYGLYVCPMIWRVLKHFSHGCVCLVMASDRFSESDYIRDYADFLSEAKCG